MTNKQYLDTLMVCNRISTDSICGLSRTCIKFLEDLDVDLRSTVKDISLLFNKNSIDCSTEETILDSLSIVLWNYRDTKIDIKDYVEGYKRFIKAFVKMYMPNDSDIERLYEIRNSIEIGPMSGIKNWKLKHWKINSIVDKPVRIGNETGYLSFRPEDSSVLDTIGLYNKSKKNIWWDRNIKAIFINGDKVEYIGSRDTRDDYKILKRIVTKDDYDLVIASFKGYNIKNILKNYLRIFKNTSMKEYIDLIGLLEDWRCDNNDVGIDFSHFYDSYIEVYDKLRKSKVKPEDVLMLLEPFYDKDFEGPVIWNRFRLLSHVLTINGITEDELNRLIHLMRLREEHLRALDIDIDSLKTTKTFNEALKIIGRCKTSDIDGYSEWKRFVDYKRLNADKRSVLVNIDNELREVVGDSGPTSKDNEQFGVIVELDL